VVNVTKSFVLVGSSDNIDYEKAMDSVTKEGTKTRAKVSDKNVPTKEDPVSKIRRNKNAPAKEENSESSSEKEKNIEEDAEDDSDKEEIVNRDKRKK